MKLPACVFLFAAFFLTTRQSFSQDLALLKYHGRVFTLDSSYEGEISVNLFGENPDTIRVEWEKVAPDSSKKTTYWVDNSVRAISFLTIEGDTFFIKNLQDDPDLIRPHSLVKRIYGTEYMGLYEFTTSNGSKKYYVGLPNRDPYYVQASSFTGDNEVMTSFLLYFNRCDDLYKNLKSGKDGYTFKPEFKPEQCVKIWKTIIDDYQICQTK